MKLTMSGEIDLKLFFFQNMLNNQISFETMLAYHMEDIHKKMSERAGGQVFLTNILGSIPVKDIIGQLDADKQENPVEGKISTKDAFLVSLELACDRFIEIEADRKKVKSVLKKLIHEPQKSESSSPAV